MVNYRVEDLPLSFSRFGDEKCNVLEKTEPTSEYGKVRLGHGSRATRSNSGSHLGTVSFHARRPNADAD